MIHALKTPPVLKPVALADMRAKIGTTRADDTSRDAAIEQYIASATAVAENITEQALITQTWTLYNHCFYPVMPLKMPVQSVASVTYLDQNGARQTVSPADYELDKQQGVVLPAYGKSWPVSRYYANSVQVEYVCGYGANPADVPEPIKDAIRFIVGQWEQFQGTIEGGIRPLTIPNAAKELLSPYIDYRRLFGQKPGLSCINAEPF